MALQVKCCLVLLVTLVVSEVSLGRSVGGAKRAPYERMGRNGPRPRPRPRPSRDLEDLVPLRDEEITRRDNSEESGLLTDTEATSKLINTIRNYHHSLINPLGNGETLSVGISFGCVRFDEKEHVLTSRVFERLSWTDSRLQWEPSDYNGITEIRLKAWYIWIPDLTLYNSVESADREWENAVIDSTGLVWYILPATYKTVCRPKAEDAHSCNFQFGSWTYDSVSLPLDMEGDGIYTDYYDLDCPYTISSPHTELVSKKYDCCDNEYQSLNITFTIQPNDYGFKIRH